MKQLTLTQAKSLATNRTPRLRAYKHKPGTFALTASFKSSEMTMGLIEVVGKMVERFTQKEIARIFRTSTATIGKMVRVYYYAHPELHVQQKEGCSVLPLRKVR